MVCMIKHHFLWTNSKEKRKKRQLQIWALEYNYLHTRKNGRPISLSTTILDGWGVISSRAVNQLLWCRATTFRWGSSSATCRVDGGAERRWGCGGDDRCKGDWHQAEPLPLQVLHGGAHVLLYQPCHLLLRRLHGAATIVIGVVAVSAVAGPVSISVTLHLQGGLKR